LGRIAAGADWAARLLRVKVGGSELRPYTFTTPFALSGNYQVEITQ